MSQVVNNVKNWTELRDLFVSKVACIAHLKQPKCTNPHIFFYFLLLYLYIAISTIYTLYLYYCHFYYLQIMKNTFTA